MNQRLTHHGDSQPGTGSRRRTCFAARLAGATPGNARRNGHEQNRKQHRDTAPGAPRPGETSASIVLDTLQPTVLERLQTAQQSAKNVVSAQPLYRQDRFVGSTVPLLVDNRGPPAEDECRITIVGDDLGILRLC